MTNNQASKHKVVAPSSFARSVAAQSIYRVGLSIKFICLILVAAIVTGCVTTTNSKFGSKADSDQAKAQYVNLALQYVKLDQYERARKHTDRALEIDDEYAPAHGINGLLFQRDGELKLAEEAFKTAIDLDDKYTRGRTYYGALLFSQGRFEEARKQFDLASKDVAFASRAQVFTNIALCDIRLGNSDSAIDAYKKSLRLDRFNGRALSGITELYIEKQDFNKANLYYTRLLGLVAQEGLKHTPQTLWQGIRIAYSLGNAEQAEVFASLLAQQYPDSAEYAQYVSRYRAG